MDPAFRASFDRWARRVRARLAAERVLTGAAAGLVVGALATGALWYTRHGQLRPLGAAGGVIGAAVGALVARRRRWDDEDVALYLDGKLGADEAIATAIELDAASEAKDEGSARAVVVSHAASALAKATPAKVRAPLWRVRHLGAPLAGGAIAYLSLMPLPPVPPGSAPPPGADKVQVAEIAGLEKVIELADLDARDDAQRERLKKLADEAKKIRDKLRAGVEKREAQADIARLRDSITAERLSLGEGEQRQGLESALGKLGQNPEMKDAAKALGDRDLTELDEQMEKLADKLEKKDREEAKKTLEEAAEAARKAGAPGVAKALEEQKRLLEERGKRADKLRELGKALGEGLPEDAKKSLEEMNNGGGGKSQQELADRLEDALEKLSPEERKRLAENLKKQAAGMPNEGGAEPPSKQELRELAEQLATPEGQKQLEDQLREMAKERGPESEESERQRALDDAQEGAGEAERQLGAPIPTPGAGGQPGSDPGQNGNKGGGKDGKDGKGDGKPQAGHSEGGGKGDHAGQTGVIGGDGVRARADTAIGKGRPMPGVVMGRTTGKPGETANLRGSGALGDVGPEEVGGIERSDVPEEYREQVGRYFQPK